MDAVFSKIGKFTIKEIWKKILHVFDIDQKIFISTSSCCICQHKLWNKKGKKQITSIYWENKSWENLKDFNTKISDSIIIFNITSDWNHINNVKLNWYVKIVKKKQANSILILYKYFKLINFLWYVFTIGKQYCRPVVQQMLNAFGIKWIKKHENIVKTQCASAYCKALQHRNEGLFNVTYQKKRYNLFG